MKFVLRIVMVLVLALMLASCGSKKRIVTKKKNAKAKTERVVVVKEDSKPSVAYDAKDRDNAPTPKTTGNANSSEIYIATYSAIAQKKMREHKIPASITLAQGILESASGKGRLAIEGNNHFGIKCHNWTGDKIYHDDDATQECFRKYRYAEQSFDDHSEFLTSRSRYAKLFELDMDDYKGWAKGLRAAGYATDRKYPDKLISLIERFQLNRFDSEVLGNSVSKPKSSDFASNLTHKVEKGDTMYSLSKRYNLSIKELQQLNGMSDTNLQLGQILIIKYN
ncbi:flagellum-specific peptidoglycan hydrolase FlgJ [Gelidibacter algens]|jgi:flagellum-specific peptidoglycan hydrolase FlgJ|uniref:Peptidoglycan hydrolase n=1 Tax=Gelidibacter algens TaxID=49280 RepID=A0A1A7R1S0_9FLAO|nr:glucosaminidase domain-containing protein [Gelidibacter algens]OBX26205.1 N-acetylmuramidase [Gelidibacter algens]RAJ22470.1 flagellum-specific peptidoglycan hydrolase FlgJ [Gelidibacter algens]